MRTPLLPPLSSPPLLSTSSERERQHLGERGCRDRHARRRTRRRRWRWARRQDARGERGLRFIADHTVVRIARPRSPTPARRGAPDVGHGRLTRMRCALSRGVWGSLSERRPEASHQALYRRSSMPCGSRMRAPRGGIASRSSTPRGTCPARKGTVRRSSWRGASQARASSTLRRSRMRDRAYQKRSPPPMLSLRPWTASA